MRCRFGASCPYPPFSHLAALLFEGEDEDATIRAAHDYAMAGKRVIADHEQWRRGVTLLGPAQAPLSRLRGKTRWQILLKAKDRGTLRGALGEILEGLSYFNPRGSHPGVKVVVDVDPQNML
jgi:primosomal protein N' (replication factor Y)